MNRRGQHLALGQALDRVELQLVEAIQSTDILLGLNSAIQSPLERPAVHTAKELVLHGLAYALQDTVIVRASGAFDFGRTNRTLDVIERLDRLGLTTDAADIKAFWADLQISHPDLRISMKRIRDRFVAHFDGRDVGTASINFEVLHSILLDYLRVLRLTRTKVGLSSARTLCLRPEVRRAAELMFATVP